MLSEVNHNQEVCEEKKLVGFVHQRNMRVSDARASWLDLNCTTALLNKLAILTNLLVHLGKSGIG